MGLGIPYRWLPFQQRWIVLPVLVTLHLAPASICTKTASNASAFIVESGFGVNNNAITENSRCSLTNPFTSWYKSSIHQNMSPRPKSKRTEMVKNSINHSEAASSSVGSNSMEREASTPESLLRTMQELLPLGLLPKLLVFDLDHTLWTPELYQLYTKPTPNRDIHLFPDALHTLRALYNLRQWWDTEKTKKESWSSEDESHDFSLAVASRTHEYEWAHSLIDRFPITTTDADNDTARAKKDKATTTVYMRDLFPIKSLVQIQTGSKRQHFQRLHSNTNIPYSSMIFFDDDEYLNLHETSGMGILSVHTPRGLTLDLVEASIQEYAKLRRTQLQQEDHGTEGSSPDPSSPSFMGRILNEQNLGISTKKRWW